jgi:hypothetical protein
MPGLPGVVPVGQTIQRHELIYITFHTVRNKISPHEAGRSPMCLLAKEPLREGSDEGNLDHQPDKGFKSG